jgi:hypothetical protein
MSRLYGFFATALAEMRFWCVVTVPVMSTSEQATEPQQRPEDGVVFVTVLRVFLQAWR